MKENDKNRKMKKEGKKKRKKSIFSYYDLDLLFPVLAACAIGLIVIYSASAYIAKSKDLPPEYFLNRQLATIAAGLFVMCITSLIPYKALFWHKKIRLPAFLRDSLHKDSFNLSLAGIFLAVITLLQAYTSYFTPVANGARRWIKMGPVTLQTSEVAKAAIIIFGAYTCARLPADKTRVFKFLGDIIAVTPLLYFIAVENLSAAIIAGGIYGAIIFANSRRLFRYIFSLFSAGFMAWNIVQGMGGYRSTRIEIWKNLEQNEKGQQILQGLYAIASGGIFGKGLGGSEQKYGRVPEAYNDMIFTIICEELGIFGGIAVIVVFAIILIRMVTVILNAKDRFGALIGIGIMSQIGIQVILNILVVTNTVPSTGVALPFISFGGSSIVFMLMEIGIFLNIAMQIKYTKKVHKKAVPK